MAKKKTKKKSAKKRSGERATKRVTTRTVTTKTTVTRNGKPPELRAFDEAHKAILEFRAKNFRVAESHARKAMFWNRKTEDERKRDAFRTLFGSYLRMVAERPKVLTQREQRKKRNCGSADSNRCRGAQWAGIRNCGIRNAKFWGN